VSRDEELGALRRTDSLSYRLFHRRVKDAVDLNDTLVKQALNLDHRSRRIALSEKDDHGFRRVHDHFVPGRRKLESLVLFKRLTKQYN
jgi:hypothetical protein